MRRRSRRSRRRNRRGGQPTPRRRQRKRKRDRSHGKWKDRAARRKTVKETNTSDYHWDGKGKKPLVAAWNTKWKQTKKKRSRLGAPPKGHAPPPPSQVVKAAVQAANIAANNVAQATNVAANKVVDATTSAANQAASKAPAFWCNDKGLTPELRKKGNCPDASPPCPPGCAPMAGGRRRNYAKPRPGPRRRRRRTRRR